jgi:threonine synthase
MKFYSTRNRGLRAGLAEAVLGGLAPDGGLYLPCDVTPLPGEFFNSARGLDFHEIAFNVLRALLADDIEEGRLRGMIQSAFDFEAPLVALDGDTSVLELFHGPTLAFKDFAAAFMSRLMAHLVEDIGRELLILVATSGDTGSAVAHGFLGVPGIRVIILYPSGRVSGLQEKQLTTAGQNVLAVEVDGAFDDCQRLAKEAFSDEVLRSKVLMSSANSINVARLAPQAIYYVSAWAARKETDRPVVFSVPSGNFGNMTAGLLAKKLGLPVRRFVAATNVNDSVPRYAASGVYEPRPTRMTISNAMDVGDPSNFERVLDLYDNDRFAIERDMAAYSFDDTATRSAIRRLFSEHGYTADPHGAVGYLGLEKYRSDTGDKAEGIFLETAHPVKFKDVVEKEIGRTIGIPERLSGVLSREKHSVRMGASYWDLRDFLFTTF